MTVFLVISLPKIPYIHRIYMVLANPTLECKKGNESYGGGKPLPHWCVWKLSNFGRKYCDHPTPQKRKNHGSWVVLSLGECYYALCVYVCVCYNTGCMCVLSLGVCYHWVSVITHCVCMCVCVITLGVCVCYHWVCVITG